jgi:hypothetical protein
MTGSGVALERRTFTSSHSPSKTFRICIAVTAVTLTVAGLGTADEYGKPRRCHRYPILTSVVPPSAAPGATGVQIYGINLVVPAAVSPNGSAMPPIVCVAGKPATVTANDQILGADRITISLASDAVAGPGTITVVRADGITAVGPAGSDGIPFTVA